MLFKSRGKETLSHPITFNCEPLELVPEYTYLGIVFSSNGSFKTATNMLKMKAAKAMFKLQGILSQNLTCTTLALKLFDTLVRPVLTFEARYGAQR